MAKTAKRKPVKVQEFQFVREWQDSGKLTYRCMELVIKCDPSNKTFSPEELDMIATMVDTLNTYYPHMK